MPPHITQILLLIINPGFGKTEIPAYLIDLGEDQHMRLTLVNCLNIIHTQICRDGGRRISVHAGDRKRCVDINDVGNHASVHNVHKIEHKWLHFHLVLNLRIFGNQWVLPFEENVCIKIHRVSLMLVSATNHIFLCVASHARDVINCPLLHYYFFFTPSLYNVRKQIHK